MLLSFAIAAAAAAKAITAAKVMIAVGTCMTIAGPYIEEKLNEQYEYDDTDENEAEDEEE